MEPGQRRRSELPKPCLSYPPSNGHDPTFLKAIYDSLYFFPLECSRDSHWSYSLLCTSNGIVCSLSHTHTQKQQHIISPWRAVGLYLFLSTWRLFTFPASLPFYGWSRTFPSLVPNWNIQLRFQVWRNQRPRIHTRMSCLPYEFSECYSRGA